MSDMETKQQKSKEYAQANYKTEIWQKEAVKCYEAGWDEALKSQWISTEERLPEPNTDVIFLTDIGMIMSGQYDDNVWMQMDGFWGSAYSSIENTWKVVAWMPIPLIDEDLKDKCIWE